MTGVPVHIQAMREQQLARGLITAAILGTFCLAGSLIRANHTWWQPVMYLHVGAYFVILGCAVLRRHLSFHLRASSVIAIGLLLAVGGLLTWGLASLGTTALFGVCVVATILYGTRAGVIWTVLSIAVVGIIGAGASTGLIAYGFDFQAYLTRPTSWLNAITGMGISGGLIVVSLGTLNMQMIELVRTADERNNELLETNKRLRIEIAERMQAEEDKLRAEVRLQRAEKMEALGTLAAGVAHDLNNVLAGIVSYPDLVLMELPEHSPLRKPVEKMQKSGEKAAAIVQDLLTLARGGVAITQVLNLNHEVTEYLGSLECEKLKSYHSDVRIETRLGGDLKSIEGCPVRLSKVVMNLVSNAAEAMPGGGMILISTENRRIEETKAGYDEIRPGGYVVLTVADTGVGISPQDMEKIFDPFYTKKVMGRSGTGLGMSVVWGTVKDHYGYIDIQSTEGRGTEFTLYFPAVAKERDHAVSPPALMVRDFMGRGEAVLVVDDVEEQREMALEMIRKLGYSVTSVPGGEAAVDHLRENSADLVLLDMIMDPGIDGLDTYKRIIEFRPKQRVILASGFTETLRVREALELGAGGFVRKPYSLERIGVAIRSELNRA